MNLFSTTYSDNNNKVAFGSPLLIKLISLKLLTLLVAALIFVATQVSFDIELSDRGFFAAFIFGGTVLLLWCLRLLTKFSVTEIEIFLLLISDVIVLYFLIENSGGSTNPFTSSLLIPLALSAALLNKKYSVAMVCVAIAVYATWTFANGEHLHHRVEANFSLHLYGMWINFLLSAILLLVFVTYAMSAVKDREKKLQKIREKMLNDEKLVTIATVTANTSHALGSPLSTMSILLEEAERERNFESEYIQLFKQQLQVCKNHLAKIANTTRSLEASQPLPMSIPEFVASLKEYFDIIHPSKAIEIHVAAFEASIKLMQNQSLQMAIVNLIENSLESSQLGISISVS
ncbi:MAG: two-component system sensor histidine kinase RegB, partial [Lentisphaeria bacterium]